MVIYINARWLLNTPSGVERYAYQITKALHHIGAPIVLICPKRGLIHKAYNTDGLTIIRYGIGHSHFWEQLILPWFFLFKKNHILFSLMGLGSLLVLRKVMTIHDLSFLHEPSWFSKWYYVFYKHMMPLAIRSSRHVFTVSEFSRTEILHYYPWIDEDKISLAPCAVDTSFFIRSNKPRENFVLAVSSLDPRKNFRTLINALNNTKIPLQIVGSSGRVFTSINLSYTSNITFLGHVDDQHLLQLYHQASVFIFPSLYEGFGLPLLEAMAAGCPVVAADIPVMHEVCGDAAVYCDPMDEIDIRRAVQQLLHCSQSELTSMAEAGYRNVERYSWISSANNIYQVIMNSYSI